MAITFACSLPSIPPAASAGRCIVPRAEVAGASRLPDSAGSQHGLRRQRRRLQPRCLSGGGVVAPRRELRRGGYDVIHIHEPLVPLVGWNAALGARSPVVGTFHAYSTKPMPNHIASALGARRVFNRLSARIAVSEAAAWTGRRWFGGHYKIVPNGVDVDAAPKAPKPASDELRVLFVGRPEERKGLPILLTAFDALVEHVPCSPHDDRRRARGRAPLHRRPGDDEQDRRSGPGIRRVPCGRRCTRPTCSALLRWPARASAWS